MLQQVFTLFYFIAEFILLQILSKNPASIWGGRTLFLLSHAWHNAYFTDYTTWQCDVNGCNNLMLQDGAINILCADSLTHVCGLTVNQYVRSHTQWEGGLVFIYTLSVEDVGTTLELSTNAALTSASSLRLCTISDLISISCPALSSSTACSCCLMRSAICCSCLFMRAVMSCSCCSDRSATTWSTSARRSSSAYNTNLMFINEMGG